MFYSVNLIHSFLMFLSPFCFFTVWSELFVDFFTLALLLRIFSEVAFLVPDSYVRRIELKVQVLS